MSQIETIKCELTIIGTGMAGNAAAVFAANRGLSVVQVGCPGQTLFASGFLDLMGVHPVQEKRVWHDPWAGIETVCRDIPDHPYSRLNRKDIQNSFEEFISFLNTSGINYRWHKDRNINVLTPMGTFKPTYGVPETMWSGVKAIEDQKPCLIIDFQRLKGFSARQIAACLKEKLPMVNTARILFPEFDYMGEIFPEHMARALELSENRKKLSQIIEKHVGNMQVVGIPAILGMYRSREILSDMEEQIGVPIFEIPTMPPSVTGLRLKEAFEQHLPKRGVRLLTPKRVMGVKFSEKGKNFIFDVGNNQLNYKIQSQSAILASGRFMGKGLHAERKRIKETIFDLPVHQPKNRAHWHLKDFLDNRGHSINLAGVEIDNLFRPLNRPGQPAFRMLFAAGSILAHQDWIRMKCGSGLAIATAFGAVKALLKLKDG
jgi:glycerol-3-phosphate dehydrogenase subunit B